MPAIRMTSAKTENCTELVSPALTRVSKYRAKVRILTNEDARLNLKPHVTSVDRTSRGFLYACDHIFEYKALYFGYEGSAIDLKQETRPWRNP